MVKPDEVVLKALAQLNRNSDFEKVLAWVEESRDSYAASACDTSDMMVCCRTQGQSLSCRSFVVYAKAAELKLNQLKQEKRREAEAKHVH